jgi:hypothetical protein
LPPSPSTRATRTTTHDEQAKQAISLSCTGHPPKKEEIEEDDSLGRKTLLANGNYVLKKRIILIGPRRNFDHKAVQWNAVL